MLTSEAERVGFEPTRRLNNAYAISNRKNYVLPCATQYLFLAFL